MTLHGVLPVYKPAGMTSHDVVAKVRKIIGLKRIGHTGTLDPAVTGVLPLCLGRATRIVEYLQDLPKEYEAELIIGLSTDTQDLSGAIIEKAERVVLTSEQIIQAVNSFLGEIEQIPPMYSAVKVDGKRLYQLAREGIEVKRQPRKVQIYKIEMLKINLADVYPRIKFTVLCSKGTYIRTLCVDIGRSLGYPSVMAELIRTQSGNMTLDQCLTLQEIEEAHLKGNLGSAVIPADQALKHLSAYVVPAATGRQASQGQSFSASMLTPLSHQPQQEKTAVRLYDESRRFVGLFKIEGNKVIPHKIFAQL